MEKKIIPFVILITLYGCSFNRIILREIKNNKIIYITSKFDDNIFIYFDRNDIVEGWALPTKGHKSLGMC